MIAQIVGDLERFSQLFNKGQGDVLVVVGNITGQMEMGDSSFLKNGKQGLFFKVAELIEVDVEVAYNCKFCHSSILAENLVQRGLINL